MGLYGFLRGQRALGAASLVVLAYLVGYLLFGYLVRWLPDWRIPFDGTKDAVGFAVFRLGIALALLIVMIPAGALAFLRARSPVHLALGWGDWSVEARDVMSKAALSSWARKMVSSFAFFLIFFLVMQANVGFRPLISGVIWPLIPAILIAALSNTLAEELIFRGVIQPYFIAMGGIAAGLWMQGLLFGLMHWGLSVGILSALPVSLLIGLGSVVWGKASLETRGISWAVVSHFLADICLMAAFFVPRV
jgi:membrane protease YdiL (CAAX protease family)